MGVLGKIAGAAKRAARNSAVAVAYRDGLMFGDDEVVKEGVTVYGPDGAPMGEKELMKARAAAKARRDRDDRKQDLLRQLLEVEGVNVDAISPARAVVDSLDIANRLCTARVRDDRVPDRLEVTWSPLTETGRVPKCVARTLVVWDYSGGDSVIVHADWDRDARPYAARVHIWRDGDRYDSKIRTVGGSLVVVSGQ